MADAQPTPTEQALMEIADMHAKTIRERNAKAEQERAARAQARQNAINFFDNLIKGDTHD